MQVQKILQKLGFSEIESSVYLAVLSLEKPGATEVSRHVQKPRTLVYFHMKKLVERGFLKESRKGRLVRFVALSPTELARTFEDLSEHLTNMVPELQSLQKAQSPAPIVEVRESRIGYKKVYDALSALPEHDFFYVLQGQSSLQTELGLLTDEEWRTWFQKINTKHIGTRAIFTEEALSVAKSRMTAENLTRHKKRLWQLKTLPEAQLPLQQLVFIYGNNVAFLMPESELVILLEHKGTADIFRALFQGLYANARRKERPWD